MDAITTYRAAIFNSGRMYTPIHTGGRVHISGTSPPVRPSPSFQLNSPPYLLLFPPATPNYLKRCLGRDSTVAYAPDTQPPALGFGGRINAHQIQQPSVKDHHCYVLLDLPPGAPTKLPIPPAGRVHRARREEGAPTSPEARVRDGATSAPGQGLTNEPGSTGRQEKDGTGSRTDAIVWEGSSSVAPATAEALGCTSKGGVVGADPAAMVTRPRTLPRAEPRRECGRGRR